MRFAQMSALGAITFISAVAIVAAQQSPPRQSSDGHASAKQDPVDVAADHYKVKLDDQRVRVLEVTLDSGERIPMHAHPAYVVYALSGGKVRFTAADGATQEIEIKEGECVARPAESHSVENIGGAQIRVLNFEFKDAPGGKMAAHDAGDHALAAAGKVHEHLVVKADAINWTDGPPGLPPGAQFMVVEGDPSKPGPFALRAKLPANYTIPPHWHPKDERVTVISGTFYMGEGDTVDKSKAVALPAGSYTVMPAKMHHFAYAEEPATLQLHGTGPWDIIYLNPSDDPRRKTSP